MKKYKYLLSIFLILIVNLALIVPSLFFFYRGSMADIVLVPDGTNIMDNGFKQLLNDAGLDYDRDYQETFDVIYPNSFDRNGYNEVIRAAFNRDADAVAFSGNEMQAQAIMDNANNPDYQNKDFIFIDDGDFKFKDYPNVIGVKFSANEAAFIEGIVSAIYLVGTYWDHPEYWKTGAWGGMQLVGVAQWLSGYEQAFNWFNYRILGADLYGAPLKDEAANHSLMLKPGERVQLINKKAETLDYSQPAQPSNSDWFVNSFEIGDGQSVATNMVSANAKILFPIAGPQTADALTVAKSHGDVKVLGVDVDANMAYDDYSDIILSSGVKNVRLASYYSFWYAEKHYLDSSPLTTNFDYGNPQMFIKPLDEGGWNEAPPTTTEQTKQNDVNPYGNQFLGTLDNDGVGATGIDPSNPDDQNQDILEAWKAFVQIATNAYPLLIDRPEFAPSWEGLDAFWNWAYTENTSDVTFDNLVGSGAIENLSEYFTISSNGESIAPGYVHESNDSSLWIPNWNN